MNFVPPELDRILRQTPELRNAFLLASPLKALADYVYVHRRDWESVRPVVESLRVDEGLLAGVAPETFDELLANYPALRVQRFLKGLRKDLKR